MNENACNRYVHSGHYFYIRDGALPWWWYVSAVICICDAKIDLYVCVCTYTYLINRDLDACKRGSRGEDVQHRVYSHKM